MRRTHPLPAPPARAPMATLPAQLQPLWALAVAIAPSRRPRSPPAGPSPAGGPAPICTRRPTRPGGPTAAAARPAGGPTAAGRGASSASPSCSPRPPPPASCRRRLPEQPPARHRPPLRRRLAGHRRPPPPSRRLTHRRPRWVQNRRVDETAVTDDGCRLWTTRSGTGDPLVLCHGGPGFWDTFGGLAGLLDDTATVHRWDQRGCGRSERRGPYTVVRSLADLDAVRRHHGLARLALLGHSWGAELALRYTLADPGLVTRLVYVSGTGIDPEATWRPDFDRNFLEHLGGHLPRWQALRARQPRRRPRSGSWPHSSSRPTSPTATGPSSRPSARRPVPRGRPRVQPGPQRRPRPLPERHAARLLPGPPGPGPAGRRRRRPPPPPVGRLPGTRPPGRPPGRPGRSRPSALGRVPGRLPLGRDRVPHLQG